MWQKFVYFYSVQNFIIHYISISQHVQSIVGLFLCLQLRVITSNAFVNILVFRCTCIYFPRVYTQEWNFWVLRHIYIWWLWQILPNNSALSQYEIICSEEKKLNIISMVMVQIREFIVEGHYECCENWESEYNACTKTLTIV